MTSCCNCRNCDKNEIFNFQINFPENYSLKRSICSYGFFLLCPNDWRHPTPTESVNADNKNSIELASSAAKGSFQRVLVTSNGHQQAYWRVFLSEGSGDGPSVIVNVSCSRAAPCVYYCSSSAGGMRSPSSACRSAGGGGSPEVAAGESGVQCIFFESVLSEHDVRSSLEAQTRRLLRADLDLTAWFADEVKARTAGFGWIFREPCLWEDMVKTILTCNTTFKRARSMARKLCFLISTVEGSFPTPLDVSVFSVSDLQKKVGLGYRAKYIFELSNYFLNNQSEIQLLESNAISADEKYKMISKLKGFGPFATSNVMQLLNHFEFLPLDTETVRNAHILLQEKGVTEANGEGKGSRGVGSRRMVKENRLEKRKKTILIFKKIRNFYLNKKFSFLSYWHDLWTHYERYKGEAFLWRQDEEGF